MANYYVDKIYGSTANVIINFKNNGDVAHNFQLAFAFFEMGTGRRISSPWFSITANPGETKAAQWTVNLVEPDFYTDKSYALWIGIYKDDKTTKLTDTDAVNIHYYLNVKAPGLPEMTDFQWKRGDGDYGHTKISLQPTAGSDGYMRTRTYIKNNTGVAQSFHFDLYFYDMSDPLKAKTYFYDDDTDVIPPGQTVYETTGPISNSKFRDLHFAGADVGAYIQIIYDGHAYGYEIPNVAHIY